jgi:membrane protein
MAWTRAAAAEPETPALDRPLVRYGLVLLAAAVALLALDSDRETGRPHRRERRDDDEAVIAALEPGRGRLADAPQEIPAKGWRDILIRLYREMTDDRVLAVAGGVTYFALLAIFPAVAALVSIYGLFADPSEVSAHLQAVAGIVPGGGVDIIGEQMARVAAQSDGALGFGFVFGLLLALWSANGGMKALIDALNVAYEEQEKRSFFKLNAIALAFTVGAIVLVLLAIGAMVGVPLALSYLPLGDMTETLVSVLRWPLLFLVVAGGLSLVYRYGPCRARAKWRWITWGSAAAALLWLAGSALFSWYAANFGSYNETYGSLGAAVGFMTWLWLSAVVVLLGAELDAEMEHQTARDTTTGMPKPLGLRHARMADTIGPAQR